MISRTVLDVHDPFSDEPAVGDGVPPRHSEVTLSQNILLTPPSHETLVVQNSRKSR